MRPLPSQSGRWHLVRSFARQQIGFVLLVMLASSSFAIDPPAGFPRELPAGVNISSTTSIPANQLGTIGSKLGGQISALTNSQVQVHGRPIQVNVITATDERNAQLIHQSLLKIKPAEYCWQKGNLVVEFVGRSVDTALAIKSANELGYRPTPIAVRYHVQAALATINEADYMSCNPLFNQLLQYENNRNPAIAQQIASLAGKFKFGDTLRLRHPELLGNAGSYKFDPQSAQSTAIGSSMDFKFSSPPQQLKIPFVKIEIDTTVDSSRSASPNTATPAPVLLQATKYWPVNDASVQSLAKSITANATTNQAKSAAILQWLSPDKNIRYEGQTGSRFGTSQVFKQRFGHCWDFSDCYVTLARAAGVPARQVAGWLYGSSGHVWAEYFDEQLGWRQVDPTGGGRLECGIYHIAYFTSDDGEMPIVYLAMPKIEIKEERTK